MALRTKRTASIALLIIVLLTAGLWTKRWEIHDSLRLRGYTPPPEIVQLATEVTFNDPSRRLFYVYHPDLQDKEAFNQNCTFSEKTIVLGCYVHGQGIYLFDVTDERLQGIEQVTAAHETLHAAYERLSVSEKKRINGLLEQTFATLADERIKATVEEYRSNGADVLNELHSILGTEVRQLPAELEAYYSKYFENRLKVVEFSEQYEKAFTELKQKVAAADQQLQVLKAQIDSLQNELDALSANLRSERSKLESLEASKNYSAYNSAVPGYNALVNTYNSKVGQLRRLIEQYNALVAERNATVVEESELIKAIDSRTDTIETQ